MKNNVEFIALVARMMGETKRMQFKCEGLKAMHDEVEITIHDLLTLHHQVILYAQRWRVIHAVSHRFVFDDCWSLETKSVIEIWGVYSN